MLKSYQNGIFSLKKQQNGFICKKSCLFKESKSGHADVSYTFFFRLTLVDDMFPLESSLLSLVGIELFGCKEVGDNGGISSI